MLTTEALPPDLAPETALPLLADLGFLANCDLPDRAGPAYLLVALRPLPTLHHFDPERVEYWVTSGGRGLRHELTVGSRLPVDEPFAWGLIRIVDRLGITNEYLAFGGRLSAARIDDTVVAAFTSPAPILRRGGHSQGWDRCADTVGAYFGRAILAVDYAPGFEATFAASDPVTRYAAFVADTADRYRHSASLRDEDVDLWATVEAEERRLRRDHPDAWSNAAYLRQAIASATRAG
jgi:hypothetical protein